MLGPRLQMVGDDPDDGLADFAVVLPKLDVLFDLASIDMGRLDHELGSPAATVFGVVGQA
ncbi:hypothetical protein OHB12_08410 [Nocardia sp. NBC_01730]|uniref:hypothetical protein n=1 Tax=Nocardia sp. NBC_01730 TaxID=2975998 RepID=UPI002E0D4A77|nr:hypothetical protein OHB12_08410 [Nocardia sp. NBC_01730]